ncbi:MAG: DUF2142 domain-containing protein [Lachnospiraceae bacterium]|nr:DUF2142 domain-containing protein [Lachnospiraceae bacterium]
MQKKCWDNKCLFVFRMIISAIVLIVGFYFAFTQKYFDTGYNKIASFDRIEAIELRTDDILEQTISFNADNVDNIGLCAVNRTNNCAGNLKMSLWEDENIVCENIVDVENLTLNKLVWFPVKQIVASQKKYTFRLTAEQMEGRLHIAGITQEENAEGIEGNAVKNGEELAQSFVLETTFRARLNLKTRILIIAWSIIIVVYILGFEQLFLNKIRGSIALFITVDIFAISTYFRFGLQFNDSLNYFMFMGLIAAFAVVAILYSILLIRKCERVEVYFVISTLVFGMIFSIILPPFSAPDEDFHFAEAYRLSNAIMGQPINDEQGYIYMRECDIQNYEWYPDNEYTIDMIKKLIRGDKEYSEEMRASNSRRNAVAPIIMYIPQSIGITIGRLLHFNYARIVFLGRWMNLMTFIVISAIAISLLPYGKWIFFAICQIPLMMEIISSYSYDILILSGTFLFVAYFVKLYQQKEKITIKQIGLLFLFSAIYGSLKPVYIPLIALVFLFPNEKLSDFRWKNYICKFAIVSIAVISFLLVNKYTFMSMKWIEDIFNNSDMENVYSEEFINEEMENYKIEDRDPCNRPNFTFLMNNPMDMLESYMGTFYVFMDEYILSLFGNYLGWYHIRIPIYISILVMLLVCFSYNINVGKVIKDINNKERLWVLFLMCGSCFAVFLSMYMRNTSPSNKLIIGVQGRYIIPLLALLPLFACKKQLISRYYSKSIVVMLSFTIQILAILSICAYIWSE